METNHKSLRLKGLLCGEALLTRGDKVVDSGKDIGFVSAGAWSPYLESGVGLIRLNETRPCDYEVKVITSSGEFDAKVVDLPFYDKEKLLVR